MHFSRVGINFMQIFWNARPTLKLDYRHFSKSIHKYVYQPEGKFTLGAGKSWFNNKPTISSL